MNHSEHPHRPFEELLQAARQGDDSAVGLLLQQCRPFLLAIANQELNPAVAAKVGASDVVQNTMISAQRCLVAFEGTQQDELLAWMRGILLNDLKDERRRFTADRRRVDRERPMDGGDRDGPQAGAVAGSFRSPSSAVVAREEELQVREAMRKLTDDEQRVIEMRNWQRLQFADIGEQLGKSAEATRKIWARAIVKLQRALGTDDDSL